MEDSRITDGRHHGYCPGLDIVCSLVTTIYYPNYPQSRPNPGYIENRCGHLPPTATNVLPGSPHQPMLQNILQNNTAKPLLIIHEMSRVTRISVTRHTSTLPRLMRSYDGLRAECGTCQYYSQIMDHVLYPTINTIYCPPTICNGAWIFMKDGPSYKQTS